MVDTSDKEALKQVSMPPSMVLKQIFSNAGEVSEELVSSAARRVLLSTKDVNLWLEHLAEVVRNRKRGAVKAAATRLRKKQAGSLTMQASTSTTEQQIRDEGHCATCGVDYNDDTGEFWILCDLCEQWFCASCEGLSEEPTTETYICSNCCVK